MRQEAKPTEGDFETRDFYLACFLRCAGYELMNLRAEGRRKVFVFRDCARRWLREGRRVRIARPPQGMDFNDLLEGGR